MNDLADLYQELILDHNRNPRNQGAIDPADGKAEGYNPLCGDKVNISLILNEGTISDIRFEGSGCAISTASCSIMTDAVKGKTIAEVQDIFDTFHRMVTDDKADVPNDPSLNKLQAFAGVGRFPARVKCATLCWHTLKAALDRKNQMVTTE